jgi:hypothetical protein
MLSRGLSLVGLLVSVAVVLVLFAVVYGTLGQRRPQPLPSRPGGPETRLGQSLEKGQEVACRNNLRQIRDALQMEADASEDGSRPASLGALAQKYALPGEMLACPVSRQPYQYDPASGTVRCATPGHGSF